MPIFRNLIIAASSAESLSEYLALNIQSVVDLHNSSVEVINTEKEDIRSFIETKSFHLERLDFNSIINKTFISILFDFCERFGFESVVRIENVLARNELFLGERRSAAKLFLLNIRNNNAYLDRFDNICIQLQNSIETEGDTDRAATATFLNYFAKVIRDTSMAYVDRLKSNIIIARANNTYQILNNPLIGNILDIDCANREVADSLIQGLIDDLYDRRVILVTDIVPENEFVIEANTEYSNSLNNQRITFDRIRQIAVTHSTWEESLTHRGVNPLTTEQDMYVYLKSYGLMHKAKLDDCFAHLPHGDITGTVEIIDWGCGVGIATMVLADFLRRPHIELDISKSTLIEPSLLSLKRAALHTQLSQIAPNIRTICKGFDDLTSLDIATNRATTKIHLFSNVLDIGEEYYSQQQLITLLQQSQCGINYFICSSPYLSDFTTNRIDAFVRSFQNCPDFVSIYSANSRPYEWEGAWTRALRVFKVILPCP